MQDYGNDPEWYTSAAGHRYAKKPDGWRPTRQVREFAGKRDGAGGGFVDALGSLILVATAAAMAIIMALNLKISNENNQEFQRTMQCGR